MTNIKEELQKVYDECTELYSKGGVTAVTDHVLKEQKENNPMYKDVMYRHCTPCDNGMPALNGICLVCGSPVVPEIGRKVRTIGEIRALISNLDNRDIAILEACDDDLYSMYIDVIEGIELLDGTMVNEVRFCQMPNVPIKIGTGIKDDKKEIRLGDVIKTVWVCPDCGSDNVQFKTWTDANTMIATHDECPMGDCYCKDCESTSLLIKTTLKSSAKVIGFQVVGVEGTKTEDEIHPDMDASFCVYNLKEANEMINNNGGRDNWRLLSIWEGDVEEPTMIFEGNVRD